mgnify:CR=1 FL=1
MYVGWGHKLGISKSIGFLQRKPMLLVEHQKFSIHWFEFPGIIYDIMEESEAKSQDFPSGEISTQPTATMTMDTKDLEDDVEELMSLFSTKHGYSICPESGRIIVNVPEGMAIVQNSRIKQYYDVDSPFRGKAGVRLSSILPFSNLIALVPDKETSVTYQIPDISEEAHAYKQERVSVSEAEAEPLQCTFTTWSKRPLSTKRTSTATSTTSRLATASLQLAMPIVW